VLASFDGDGANVGTPNSTQMLMWKISFVVHHYTLSTATVRIAEICINQHGKN
jgi:hypothetical protein